MIHALLSADETNPPDVLLVTQITRLDPHKITNASSQSSTPFIQLHRLVLKIDNYRFFHIIYRILGSEYETPVQKTKSLSIA